MSTFGPMVDSTWLTAHLADPTLRVIDFRWEDGQPGRAGYEAGSWSDWSTRPDAPVATGEEVPHPVARG
ncbi:MAG TPA: hypothetical protein VGL20_01245 [Candidatus Dormibacteraeota bacterium]